MDTMPPYRTSPPAFSSIEGAIQAMREGEVIRSVLMFD